MALLLLAVGAAGAALGAALGDWRDLPDFLPMIATKHSLEWKHSSSLENGGLLSYMDHIITFEGNVTFNGWQLTNPGTTQPCPHRICQMAEAPGSMVIISVNITPHVSGLRLCIATSSPGCTFIQFQINHNWFLDLLSWGPNSFERCTDINDGSTMLHWAHDQATLSVTCFWVTWIFTSTIISQLPRLHLQHVGDRVHTTRQHVLSICTTWFVCFKPEQHPLDSHFFFHVMMIAPNLWLWVSASASQ